ncbi:MAG: FtsX-like permease family protein [Thermoanaerobaculia bacterium]|nr:MAG: FtsX-like permease family protein [Thermoanaerobaculia bacterium]
MFSRMLVESLLRRGPRKLLATLAVWLGVTLVVALLALSLDVGDKMNRELTSFGANIRLEPASAALPVRVGGHELAAVEPAFLDESGLVALKSIFWSNNLLRVSPRLWTKARVDGHQRALLGVHLDDRPEPWRVLGDWPSRDDECLIGAALAREATLATGQEVRIGETTLRIRGIVTTGGPEDAAVVASLAAVQRLVGLEGKVSEVEISALTTPENKLADKYRVDPKTLTSAEYERWYCTPYPGSVAADIQKAVPGSAARVVRRVSESQGVVLTRIRGLVFSLALLTLLASTLSTMGVLTSAVLERRTEVALMRAIGAHGENVLRLFLAEAALLGLAGGALAAATGSWLGAWLVQAVFGGDAETHLALWLLAPLLGLVTALAGSALPVGHTLRQNTAEVLHGS